MLGFVAVVVMAVVVGGLWLARLFLVPVLSAGCRCSGPMAARCCWRRGSTWLPMIGKRHAHGAGGRHRHRSAAAGAAAVLLSAVAVLPGALWTLLRGLPPLTVLLLLLSNRPTLAIGALALGLHNAGVMGRLLQEGLDQQDDGCRNLRSSGARQVSWLYGLLLPGPPISPTGPIAAM